MSIEDPAYNGVNFTMINLDVPEDMGEAVYILSSWNRSKRTDIVKVVSYIGIWAGNE